MEGQHFQRRPFLSASDKDYVAIRDQNLISSFRGTKIGGFPKLLKNLGMGNYHPSQDGGNHMGKPVSRLRFPNPNIPIREFHGWISGMCCNHFWRFEIWSGFFLRNSFRRMSPKLHAIFSRGGWNTFYIHTPFLNVSENQITRARFVHSSRKFEFKFELTSQWIQWLIPINIDAQAQKKWEPSNQEDLSIL